MVENRTVRRHLGPKAAGTGTRSRPEPVERTPAIVIVIIIIIIIIDILERNDWSFGRNFPAGENLTNTGPNRLGTAAVVV